MKLRMDSISVYGTVRQWFEVDPVHVVGRLIEQAIGKDAWVFEREGKCFLAIEQTAGCHAHAYEEEREIPRELHDYVTALYSVRQYLDKIEISNSFK